MVQRHRSCLWHVGLVLSLSATASAPLSAQEPPIEISDEEQRLIDETLAEGETIEVVGDKPIDPSPPGVADVSREELHVMAGSRGDAIGAIRNLPGIANADAYDGSGVLAIRGTSGEDSIVLIDGIPVPLAMHFGNVTSVIPTEMIENIELQPGGFGVEYGRATGGILSVSTRSVMPTDWSGFTELSFINVAGFVEGPISKRRKIHMAMGFRRSIIDALLPAILPDDATLSFQIPPRYYDGQLRINWDAPGGHELTFLAFASDDRVKLRVDGVDPLDPAFTGDIAARESFWRAALGWSYASTDLDNRATISFGRDHREQTLGGDAMFYRLEPAAFTLRDELTWRAHKKLRVRAGSDLEASGGNIAAHITLPPGEGAADPILAGDALIEYDEYTSEVRSAGWVALDILPNKVITVTPQIRVDRFGRTTSTIVQPRLSASLQFSPQVTLRAAAGAYSRPLALAEQLRSDLEPERAYHVTSGIEVLPIEGLRVTATGFATELRDLVVRDPEFMGQDALGAYQNTGTGQVVGVELLVRANRRNASGWLAYTTSQSTRVDQPGMPRRLFDYDQPHNLTAVASYKFGAWRFGGRFRLSSGTPTTPFVGSTYDSDGNFYRPIEGEQNSERTDLDHQLDLRVDRRFKIGALVLDGFLDVANVYSHPKHLGYDYSFDYTERARLTDVPILPSIGLRGTYQ